jgi:uncharacterized iron-regulated membrane protein
MTAARSLVLRLHRWCGLVTALFLVIAALTGSLLAFYEELDRWTAPQFRVAERADLPLLEAGTLAERAQTLVPEAWVTEIYLRHPGRAEAYVAPRADQPDLGFNQLILDPYTGAELGRRTWGDLTQGWHNVMPFLYRVHYELAGGAVGLAIMGGVTVIWTINCLFGLLLTLPSPLWAAGISRGFFSRWLPAWLIKREATTGRRLFDLHRATGLWLWPVLLVFAWSSVYMTLWDTVYSWATKAVMEYRPYWSELPSLATPLEKPPVSWPAAYALGLQLMETQGRQHGFRMNEPIDFRYSSKTGLHLLRVRSSLDFQSKRGVTDLYFDSATGNVRLLLLPQGQYRGNTVTNWLDALHMANVFGTPYRVFIFLLGLAISALCLSGVLVWWRKRRRSRQSPPADLSTVKS